MTTRLNSAIKKYGTIVAYMFYPETFVLYKDVAIAEPVRTISFWTPVSRSEYTFDQGSGADGANLLTCPLELNVMARNASSTLDMGESGAEDGNRKLPT